MLAAYTAVPSLVDYTTGAIPVTFADENLDLEVFEHVPVNEKDMENWKMCKSYLLPSCRATH